MIVAEMIEALKQLPQGLEVWTYGIATNGSAEPALALPPELVVPNGHLLPRVVIDGGCV